MCYFLPCVVLCSIHAKRNPNWLDGLPAGKSPIDDMIPIRINFKLLKERAPNQITRLSNGLARVPSATKAAPINHLVRMLCYEYKVAVPPNTSSRFSISRLYTTARAAPCKKFTHKEYPPDSLLKYSKISFLRISALPPMRLHARLVVRWRLPCRKDKEGAGSTAICDAPSFLDSCDS